MSGRTLVPGELPSHERRGRTERHLLALTGGGFRGLFTATVLRQLECDSGEPLANRFDMLAGTSIGGILAIGLACGISSADLAELMREHGPAIFHSRFWTVAGLTSARYSAVGLEGAIEKVLGRARVKQPFRDIPIPLVVCSVDELTSQPRLFRTAAADPGGGDATSIMDVALATSAAPTYFPPHRIDDRPHVDGGLIANAPDAVLLSEAMRRFGASLDECHLLSIGTAASPRLGAAGDAPGKLGWVAKHALVDLIMTAQEGLVVAQVEALRPGTFLRIDRPPAEPIRLDDVSAATRELLIALGEQAYGSAQLNRLVDLRRFLAHVPVP